jgi:RHS repeat-associated protein
MLIENITCNLRFPGQYADDETGLYYNWHRYYDPDTGRYLTPDPIGLAGGINPFLYCLNNPIIRSDPKGLDYYSDTQAAADIAADVIMQSGSLKTCKCSVRWNRKRMDCSLYIADDDLWGYHKCMVNALAEFRQCVGFPESKIRELKPPPGAEQYPESPYPNRNQHNYPNW